MADKSRNLKDIWRMGEFVDEALDRKGIDQDKLKSYMPRMFEIVRTREGKDPIAMYEEIMVIMEEEWPASDHLPVHGAWHHALVPGILIRCLQNSGEDFNEEDVQEALQRGIMIPGGSCGFHGVCGAAVGAGVAVSIVERTTPLHDQERSTALRVNARAQACIAELGGSRCCPRATYATFELATMELGAIGHPLAFTGARGRCKFSDKNQDCIKERCPFYPRRDLNGSD